MKQNKPLAKTALRRNALALAISAALPFGVAHADEEFVELPAVEVSATVKDDYKVDQSTSPKYTQPLLDTAKTITVIPESLMKDRNVDSLRDALRNVPGISLAAGEGGTPTGDQMSIRGFDARNNIMIDNVRDIAGYTRDTYNIEAVEVAKGPGSAVYGRGATGGSINLQTKTAKLDDFNDISLRMGSENDHRAQLDSNTTLGERTALRINLLTDDGNVAGRDEVENAKNAIALSFATGLNTDTRFTVNADYQKQDNLPDYGIPWVSNSADADPVAALAAYEGKAPPVDFSNFYGNVHRDFEDIEAQSLTAKFEHDINESTTLRLLGRIGSVERQSIVNAPRFDDLENSTDVGLDHQKTRDTKDSLKVVQLDLIGQYQTAGITHDVVTGIELAREEFERWNYDAVVADNLGLVDLFNPDSGMAFTGRYARTGKDEEATGDTTAVYLFDTLTLNPQWQVSMGLRYDIFDTEYYYDLSGADPSVKLEAKDKKLSWNSGIVYKPAVNGSIYFAVGTSFNPTTEDLTVSTSGNGANLDPEETVSYELGTKWELINDRLFTSVALFRTDKTNALSDAPDGFFDADDGRFDVLNGEQRVQGLELSAAGRLTDKLTITAAYTYQDSEVIKATGDDKADQEGNELARTPEHSFSVWSRYDFNDKWAAGLGTQYVGERYNSASSSGREKADDFLIWDMMVSYRINNQWGLQLNGSNLTDEEYIDQLGGGHFVPGEGRYVSMTTTFSF